MYSQLDQNHIIQRVFDEVNDRLKVDASVTAVIESVNVSVDLDAATDSIAIKDQTTGYALVVNADGSINVNVSVDAADGDNIAIHDSGGDELAINTDGSINVTVVEDPGTYLTRNIYNEITSVASGVETTISTYTVPVGKYSYLTRAEFSGDQVARYRIYIDSVTQASRRTNFGTNLSDDMSFFSGSNDGIYLIAGSVVNLTVLHDRTGSGNFEGRLQLIERVI